MGSAESFIELVQEKVDNPLDFSRVLKAAFQSRGNDTSKFNVSHLYGLNFYLQRFSHSHMIICYRHLSF